MLVLREQTQKFSPYSVTIWMSDLGQLPSPLQGLIFFFCRNMGVVLGESQDPFQLRHLLLSRKSVICQDGTAPTARDEQHWEQKNGDRRLVAFAVLILQQMCPALQPEGSGFGFRGGNLHSQITHVEGNLTRPGVWSDITWPGWNCWHLVRSVLGGHRKQLVVQQSGETMTPDGRSGLGFYVFRLQTSFISNSQNINIVHFVMEVSRFLVWIYVSKTITEI